MQGAMGNQMAQMQPQMQPQMQSYQMMSMQGVGAQQMPHPTPTTQMPGGGGPSGSAFGFVSSSGQMGQPMKSAQGCAGVYAPPPGMGSGRLDEPTTKDCQFGFVADEMKGASREVAF